MIAENSGPNVGSKTTIDSNVVADAIDEKRDATTSVEMQSNLLRSEEQRMDVLLV